MDITATIIGVIISLITIVGFFLKLSNDNNKRETEQAIAMAKLNTQLCQIQKDIIEMKEMVSKRDDRIENLEKEVFEIKTKCRYIQDKKKKGE